MHLKFSLEPIPQALLSLVFRLPSKSLVVNLSKNQSHMGPFTSIMFHLQGTAFLSVDYLFASGSTRPDFNTTRSDMKVII